MLNVSPDILRIEYTPNNEGFSIYVFGNKVFQQDKPVPGSDKTVVQTAEEIAASYYENTVKAKALEDLYEYYVNVFYNGLYKDKVAGNFWRASYEAVGSMKSLIELATTRGDTSVVLYDYDDKAVTLSLTDAKTILMELANYIDKAYRDYKAAKRAIKDDTTGAAYEILSTFIANHQAKMTPDEFTSNPYGSTGIGMI